MGHWVINGIRVSGEEIEEYNKIEQHIYSFFKRFEADKKIEFAGEYMEYFPTKNLEDTVYEYLEEYDDYCFWEELERRMALVELLKKKQNPTLEEKLEMEEKYENEFCENGLKRLIVDWNKKV